MEKLVCWTGIVVVLAYGTIMVNCEESVEGLTDGHRMLDNDGLWSSADREGFMAPDYPNFRSNSNPFFKSNKRAIFGILGLATKRPHKTAAEIQHLPPDDAFLPLRGKKSSGGEEPEPSLLLPSTQYRLRPLPVMPDLKW